MGNMITDNIETQKSDNIEKQKSDISYQYDYHYNNNIREQRVFTNGLLTKIFKYDYLSNLLEIEELNITGNQSYKKTYYYLSGKKKTVVFYDKLGYIERQLGYYNNEDNSLNYDTCTEENKEYIIWHQNKNIITISRYNNDTNLQETVNFDKDGKLKNEIISKNVNDKYIPIKTTEYYENGAVKKIISIDNKISNIRYIEEFADNGIKLIEDIYYDDKLDGKCIKWNNNGLIDIEMEFSYGIPVGIWKFHNLVPDNISILEWKYGKIISTINFPIEKDLLNDDKNTNLLINKEIEII
jgi:antitoxin component YwqK of YwqJK toxin-antitoxin module